MGVEDAPGIIVEHIRAAPQPLFRLDRTLGAVEVELPDLGEPALQLLQIDIVLFQFGIGVVAGGDLLGDLALEVVALVEEFT